MNDKLNLSLDDIIRDKKKSQVNEKRNNFYDNKRKFRGKPNKNFSRDERDNYKKWDNFSKRRSYNFNKDHDRDCRLKISNLHYNVMNNDLYSLFSSVGKLRRCGIHWDKAGISKGTADVEYENYQDAKRAADSLNGAELEGMRILVEFSSKSNY